MLNRIIEKCSGFLVLVIILFFIIPVQYSVAQYYQPAPALAPPQVFPTAPTVSPNPVQVNTAVTFNGDPTSCCPTSSYTYGWKLVSIPSGSSAALSSTTVQNPTFTPDLAGSYVACLIVTDSYARSSSQQCVTLVANTPPQPSTPSSIPLAPTTTPGSATQPPGPIQSPTGQQTQSPTESSECYIKIDGINGESNEAGLTGAIKIQSYGWPSNSKSSAGSQASAVNQMYFVHSTDKASPQLYKAIANGNHFNNGQLLCRKAGGEQQPYLSYTMSDVLISSFSQINGGEIPAEKVWLSFVSSQTLVDTYNLTPQNQLNPQPLPPTPAGTNQVPPGPAQTPMVQKVIPSWIKNTAKWWSEDQINQDEFLKGIEYLVQNGIINAGQNTQPPGSANTSPDQQTQSPTGPIQTPMVQKVIPDWIKNTANLWSQGKLDESEFLKGIDWLVQNGMIRKGCACKTLGVEPAHKGMKLNTDTFIQPTSSFTQSGTTVTVTVDIPYVVWLTCDSEINSQTCSGYVRVSITSSGWSVNGVPATPTKEDVMSDNKNPNDPVTAHCIGPCDLKYHIISKHATYTATFKPGALPVTGKLTIAWNSICELSNVGQPWESWGMVLVLDSNQKKTGGIDVPNSDWDGDGITNDQQMKKGGSPFGSRYHS